MIVAECTKPLPPIMSLSECLSNDDKMGEPEDDEDDDVLLLLRTAVLRSNHVIDTSAFPLARRPVTLPPAIAISDGKAGSRIK